MSVPDLLFAAHWNLRSRLRHPGLVGLAGDLRRESSLTPGEWMDLTLGRLRTTLRLASQAVPYYRTRFAALGFDPEVAPLPEGLARLPVLTREELRTRREELVADTADRSRLQPNATGGSTGTPVTFFQDARYRTVALAAAATVRGWWGIRPWDKSASVWGADRDFSEMSLRGRFHQWRSRTRTLNAFRMTEVDLEGFCRMLRRWKPPHLIGYASALEALARFAEAHGHTGLRFRAIRSAAEVLWPAQRERIERVFQSPVYDFYGSREINCLAAECPEGRRLHWISSWRYPEVVDDAGRPVPPGTAGYLLVSDLSNASMPLLRYRNEDVVRMAAAPCPCGRPTPVIESLLGRSSDLIRTRTGELIHGEFFTHLFYGRNDIRQFQVHQTALDRVVVRFVAGEGGAREFLEGVRKKIEGRLGPGVRVELEACDAIPVPPSGKHRFTISDIRAFPERGAP